MRKAKPIHPGADALPVSSAAARKRRRRRIAATSSLLSAVLFGTLVLAFQCRPAWYVPVVADEEVLRRARRESASAIDQTSRQLARRKSFELHFTRQQINEWLASLGQLWPEWGEALPEGVGGLAVELEEGRIRVGALVERGGVRVVMNGALRIELTPDGESLRVRLENLRGGRLPVPKRMLQTVRGVIAGEDDSDRDRGTNLLDLMDGVEFPNVFVWPNGERDFRLKALRISPEGAFLTLEPR